MICVATVGALRRAVAAARAAGKRIGFVPTMGCLHAGHAALIAEARRRAGFVAVSIFVNPLQFGPAEDYESYPRTPSADRAICRAGGVDVLFVPGNVPLYAPDRSVYVDENTLARGLCGAGRPGHFRGVLTVVAKLFNLVQPDLAVFGRKDAQQAALVRRMVRDLDFPVRIIVAPTVREPDGLAMSSRNRLLNADARGRASVIYRALREAHAAYCAGQRDASRIRRMLIDRIAAQPGFRIEYAVAVDEETLEPVVELRGGAMLAVAVHAGGVRLIDNLPLA